MRGQRGSPRQGVHVNDGGCRSLPGPAAIAEDGMPPEPEVAGHLGREVLAGTLMESERDVQAPDRLLPDDGGAVLAPSNRLASVSMPMPASSIRGSENPRISRS